MANIVGEPFDQYVLDQISNRQKIHGSQERTPSEISYVNARTGYIKITSGVKVMDAERIKRIDLGNHASFINAGPDQGLANFFVLFNGTSDNNNTLFGGIDGFSDGYTTKPTSIDKGQTILNKSAYGSGDHDFGTRPMAGIISAETKFRNRGSIREGTIQIKAWNRTQFEIINLLYLRLGFPMLLEWGHTIYVDEVGGINSSPNFSFSKSFLRGDFKTDNQILETLEIQRKKSAGNYDAMYGKVVNFDWTFNKDGSYNITLKLISVGAVVEALKMNVYQKDVVKGITNSGEREDSDNVPDNDEDWIEKFQYSHTIGSIFWKAMKLLYGGNIVGVWDTIDYINGSELSTPSDKIENLKYVNGNPADKDYILYGLDGVDEFFLIRFGELTRLLKNLLPHNNIDSDNPLPIVDIIDLDDIPDLNNLKTTDPKAKNVVFMYTTPQQISGNPGKCLIGGFPHPINTGETYLEPLASNLYKTTIKNYQVGLLKDVYVNMAFILQILQDNVDKDGNVSFIDLLNAILTGVNECLGSVNHIECIVDENENIIKFIDSTPIPGHDIITGVQEQYDRAVPFNIYGYYNNFTSAGFVRDFSLKTEITNNLAAMMTIGATANGSVVGEDATAFSKWNKGLLPIIGENLISGFADPKKAAPKPTVSSAQDEIDALIKENEQLLKDYGVFVDESNTYDLDEEEIASGNQLVANILEYYKNLGLLEEKKKQLTTNPNKTPALVSATSSRGFLPINLSLTMDGLSGVKIFQQIKVDTSYLPSDYPGVLKFLIKGVSHKIDRGGWITTVETVSVPVIDSLQLPATSGTTPTTQQIISQQQSPDNKNAGRNISNPQNTPNANKLRNILKSLGYSEKGQEISNGGDISPEIEKAVSSVLNTIKTELPSVKVIITGGNDKYHKTLSYNSRHKMGNAIDLVISPNNVATLDKVVTILQRYAAGNSPNFRFIDEYRHLTKAGTGNHFHLSWGTGTESQNELDKAKKLALEGKITPIKIA